MKALPGDRHFLYRVYSETGELLYIGATSKREARMKEYDMRPAAAVIEFDEYPTRAEAFAAERAAIAEMRPPWNTQSIKETA